MPNEALRQFDEVHIEQDCSDLSGTHNNGLFFGCQFKKLNGLSLLNCDLNRSEFSTDSIADALDFAVTLNCHSFRGVKMSPLLFDLILSLLMMTEGNEVKKAKLKDVIGADRADAILRVLKRVE